MRKFTIAPIACSELEQAAREKIDNLTKPKGSLWGVWRNWPLQVLYDSADLVAFVEQSHNLLFAADHGIVEERSVLRRRRLPGSKSVISCTEEPVSTFCAVSMDSAQIIDAGVDYDLPTKRHH